MIVLQRRETQMRWAFDSARLTRHSSFAAATLHAILLRKQSNSASKCSW